MCSEYIETYQRCKAKKVGLVDGIRFSQARGDYCKDHSCMKCGIRRDGTHRGYCRNCECVAMGCSDGRSDVYKMSRYCTVHTCPKCQVRTKDRSKHRCTVCQEATAVKVHPTRGDTRK